MGEGNFVKYLIGHLQIGEKEARKEEQCPDGGAKFAPQCVLVTRSSALRRDEGE